MAFHVWSIITNRESLWVAWMHSYPLRGRTLWNCKPVTNCCWSWRKIIQIRSEFRRCIWVKLGNGNSTSAWYDFWCDGGPLCSFLSPRVITRAGFGLADTVQDVYGDGTWNWPVEWRNLFPVINQLDQLHCNPDTSDRTLWKVGNNLTDFSSSSAWDSIRNTEADVDWVKIVWFSQCIPRHAFNMWLVMRGKLLTQDKILQCDLSRRKSMNMMCCVLCYANVDSHEHLFFECGFSSQVWSSVRTKGNMASVDSKWRNIVD
ncbi:uncharacterized protein LOC110931762 [Helianthus annuus]|uniref:uncharacterized protein LOC110931762 n=1 Tax=Helianthus annuus TaxID=4232 RepID=UPI000B8F81AE|nr:uncharacterized protein LOC110931762 [Helianthus annuus]